MLEAAISASEIKREIFKMPPNKTLGPDGTLVNFSEHPGKLLAMMS